LNAGTVKLKTNKPMKLKSLPIFVAFSLTAFVSCKNEQSGEANSPADSPPAESGYPLETCVVSGEKLGSMGEPFVITHEGTEVRFCCDSCLPKFKKDPAKYLAKLKK
jgi:YHS domain-containing protein